jgi:hypothetical protein
VLWLAHRKLPGLVLLAEGAYKINLAVFLFHIVDRRKIFFYANFYLETLEVD